MTDIDKARKLLKQSGLAFPTIPVELSARLKERREWLFSTRERELGHDQYRHPYWLLSYVDEASKNDIDDYVVLAHGGHGFNSYAIQYYLVYANLRMFLHLLWGGAYMDPKETADQVTECFGVADEIVAAIEANAVPQDETLTIVCSDSYNSYWHLGGGSPSKPDNDLRHPMDVLTEALHWIKRRGN